MTENLDEIIWNLVLWLPIGVLLFGTITLDSYDYFSAKRASVPLLETYRKVVKTHYWFSILVFVFLEVLFTSLDFEPVLLDKQTSSTFWYFVWGAIVWLLWGAISFFLLILTMLPYSNCFRHISDSFKTIAIPIAKRVMEKDESLTITSLKPNKLLPDRIVQKITEQSSRTIDYIERSTQSIKYRFTVNSTNQDHFEFKNSESRLEFWESVLDFEAEEETSDSDEAKSWNTVYEEKLFDGLCIRLKDVFETIQPTQLLQIIEITPNAEGKTIRPTQETNFFVDIWCSTSSNTIMDSKTGLVPKYSFNFKTLPLKAEKLKTVYTDLHYVGIHKQDLFLFVHTGLDGNLFEFYQNRSAEENIKLLEEDILLVRKQVEVAKTVLDRVTNGELFPQTK
jgi:hypothetical protein